jgi:acetyl esterase
MTMRRDDYARLIDPETRDFIARTDAWFPPETAGLPIGEQRRIYDAMCRAFHPGRPAGVTATDAAIGDRTARLYRFGTPAATIVYYHGGGFILGDLDSHDDVCADLCAGTGYEVVSIDYRLAPDHPHPAAFLDAVAAFEWAAAASERPLVLCGESAGGTLAAAVAHATRRHRRAAVGQLLIYPSLGGDMSRGSYVEHADAPMLTTADVRFYRDIRFAGGPGVVDPTTAPLADPDFTGLPPTIIVTAQCDPLSSDGEAYRDRVLGAGGRAAWVEEAGLVHSFLRARGTVPRAAAAFARIVSAVSALGWGQQRAA